MWKRRVPDIHFFSHEIDRSVSIGLSGTHTVRTISNNATFKEDIAALKANAKYWRSKMIGSRRLDKKRLAFASSGTDYTLHALHMYQTSVKKKYTSIYHLGVFLSIKNQ